MDRDQSLWVHISKRDPVFSRHRKRDSLWTEIGPSGCIQAKGTTYPVNIGKGTVYGLRMVPLGAYKQKGPRIQST